jgi:toxin-antitoxin system PIN domain toxin
MTPDLNVLLAASRADHPQHRPALGWLEQAIVLCETGGSIELLPMVSAGFLRLATNPKLFTSPMPIAAAVAFVDSLLVIPGVEMPELGREWPTLRQLSCDLGLAVNAITDAWIAAAVRTIGSHLVTFDKGFRRLLGNAELTVLKPDQAGG